MKPTYEEVTALANKIIKGHAEDETCYGSEYAAACGNFMAVLGMVISGDITKEHAFQSLKDNAKRLKQL